MSDYSRYSDRELEEIRSRNNRALRDPYEENKWIEREENARIDDELARRRRKNSW